MQDLHPATASPGVKSEINAMSAGQQGGFAGNKAAIWSGSARSYLSIHPAGYTQSTVLGMGNGQTVGVATLVDPTQPDSSIQHALLWTVTSAASVIERGREQRAV